MRLTAKIRGFTLIELLVVISIIGLLASVVLASLNDARDSAQDTRRKLDLQNVKNSLLMFYSRNGRYPSETWCDSSIGSANTACPIAIPAAGWDQTSAFYQDFVVNGGFRLPVDPLNDGTFYYYYEPTGNNGLPGYIFRSRLSNGSFWSVCAGDYADAHINTCH